jgi:hypothetical protein
MNLSSPDGVPTGGRRDQRDPQRSGRHAFMIMAHEDPIVLRALLASLDDPRHDIYLHVDARARGMDVASLADGVRRAHTEVVTPMKVNWGGFSQVRCELALLERATQDPHEYYHLLSGADLPLVGPDALHAFFDEHRGTEFVHFVPGPLPAHIVDRVAVRHLFVERGRAGQRSLASRVKGRVEGWSSTLQRRWYRQVVPDEFHWGSQWFSISDDLARYVVSQRAWVERTFRRALNADEHFLQTLVVGSPFVDRLRVAADAPDRNGAARLIDWSRGGGHSPHVWRMDDLDVLLTGPEQGYVFARKFSSTTDAAVMAAITERCW